MAVNRWFSAFIFGHNNIQTRATRSDLVCDNIIPPLHAVVYSYSVGVAQFSAILKIIQADYVTWQLTILCDPLCIYLHSITVSHAFRRRDTFNTCACAHLHTHYSRIWSGLYLSDFHWAGGVRVSTGYDWPSDCSGHGGFHIGTV